ncbi:prolyl oligopeptidase family serine peptidase [Tautonia marina]|uniref:prolyl oligopeptidase family serine peptidase n=1 Tax=Tautonia marina TaxID=2653855 RepID=UPI00191C1F5F|nr:prolyl oligopeptidase family serine peptidase [Tautonia marina]
MRITERPLFPALCLAGAVLLMTAPDPASAGPPDDAKRTPLDYPEAARGDVVDDYHGTPVADPYRWMEDIDSTETRAWVEAQVALFDSYIADVPARKRIEDRLTQLWDYEKFGIPFEKGGRYFYSYNSGLQNQNVIYSTPSLAADAQVLIDPNTFSADGTIALAGLAPSKDGSKVAYAVSDAGSDWMTWKVRDVASGDDLDDLIRWSKFSGAEWTPDGSGFFYGRFPEPEDGSDLRAANFYQKVYYHQLGTSQDDDALIWEDPENKDLRADATVTDDGAYLILTLGRGTDDKYRILYRPLADTDAEPIHLVGDFDADYTFIDNDGPRLFFRTDKETPLGKVIAINVHHPEPEHWETIIPEAEETLLGANRVGPFLIAQYLKDARSQVKLYDLAGAFVREVEFPELGTASGFSGDRDNTETFYSFSSYTRPSTIYRYDLATGESTLYKEPQVGFNPDDYTTEQVFYTSKDGTRVPMFISHKKGIEIGPETPTLLYGYGGFNIPLTPSFSVSRLVWMEMGGVYAVPNLRGGGEYGEAWHKAGTKLQKQNVFDDFIAAAEYLIDQGRTSTPKLAIQGRSNGGLLVGACMTQRPDLFGACLPGVGVLDMLRFHTFTIGWAWTDDYGSSENADEFEALYAYSPYHRVEQGACYPPTLIVTADHDDRVYPAHSFKFAAAMQEAQGCDNPILIRIETRAGHGAGKPTAKIIEEAADEMAFVVHELGVSLPDAD